MESVWVYKTATVVREYIIADRDLEEGRVVFFNVIITMVSTSLGDLLHHGDAEEGGSHFYR